MLCVVTRGESTGGGGWQNYGQQRTTGNNPRFAGFPTSRTKEGKLVVPTGDSLFAVKQAVGEKGGVVKEREERWKIYRERGKSEEERERERMEKNEPVSNTNPTITLETLEAP